MPNLEDRTWVVLLLAVVGLFAAPGVRSSNPSTLAAPVASSAVVAGSQPPSPGDAAVLQSLLRRLVDPAATPSALPARQHEALLSALAEATGASSTAATPKELAEDVRARGYALSVVLVTVPDPRRGHMAVYFDQAIDALRRGAGALGLSQGRHDLPWSRATRAPDTPVDASASSGIGWTLFQRTWRPGEEKPRGGGDRGNVLLALVLTESPVLGLSRSELREAVRVADSMRAAGDPLAVLGPFFSGSADLLGTELALSKVAPPVRIVSGTATRQDIGPRVTRDRGGVSFARTLGDDHTLFEFLIRELRHRTNAVRPLRVAVLSEFDTSFGAGVVNDPEPGDANAAPKPKDERDYVVKRFSFPSSISRLRLARLQQQQEKPNKEGVDLRRTLALRLDPGEEAAFLDVPEPTSKLTPYQQELSLSQELLRICRDRYDYLVLVATDPVDVVFLAQESRKYCPGVTLLTFGADQLYLHPDLSGTLNGLMVASSYPLLFALPPWRDRGSTQPFASHVAQGFYNAFLATLSAAGHEVAPYLAGYTAQRLAPSCGGSQHGPPLWLTMVAGTRYWPLSLRCAPADLRGDARVEPAGDVWPLPPTPAGDPSQPSTAPNGTAPAPAASPTEARAPKARVTGMALGVGVLILFLIALHVSAVLVASLRPPWRFPLAPWLRAASGPYELLHLRYRIGAHLSLGTLILLLAPAARHVAEFARGPWLFRVWIGFGVHLGIALALALVLVALYDARRFLPTILRGPLAKPPQLHAWFTGTFFCVIAFALFGLSLYWLVSFHSAPELERQMILTRTLDPLGMSPAAPMLYIALGYYAWSLFGLRRVHVLGRVSTAAPLSDEPDGEARRCDHESALGAVLRTLGGFWSGVLWPYELAALILLVFPGVYFALRLLPTFEGRAYDWLIQLGFCTLYTAVAIALVHLALLAGQLRLFLHQLAAHPMVDAYDRIAKKVTGSFGLELRARIPSFDELRLSSYSAALLATLSKSDFLDQDLDPRYRSVFAKGLPRLEECAEKVRSALRGLCTRTEDESAAENRGHRALFAAACELFAMLRELWKLRTEVPSPERYGAGIGLDELLPGGSRGNTPTVALYMGGVPPRLFVWMRMAEDFVALRVATFVNHVIFHLRNLLVFALVTGLLLILSMSAYPFQPGRFVTVFSWALMFAIVSAAFILIVRMRRNEILSRLSGSKPGSIGLDFSLLSQLSVYVVLPLVAVLSNIFPEIRDVLFAWVEPLQQLLP